MAETDLQCVHFDLNLVEKWKVNTLGTYHLEVLTEAVREGLSLDPCHSKLTSDGVGKSDQWIVLKF